MVAPLALVLSLALNACANAPASTTQPTTTQQKTTAPQGDTSGAAKTASKPAAAPISEAPKYGGQINIALPADITTFDDPVQGACCSNASTQGESLWEGDWTKGPAGGHGTKETDWAIQGYDLFEHKMGWIAESWKVEIDKDKQEGKIIYKIRPGVKWAVNPASEGSKLVGGREVTPEDVMSSLKWETTDSRAYIFRGYPTLRGKVEPVKTGPMEVTIKVALKDLTIALSGLNNKMRIYPEEIRKLDTSTWKNIVGTGAYMVTDYVSGSKLIKTRNPNYWMKDPIGPGKGNQLPYVETVQYLIIPDISTRLSAFRTGKVDQIENLSWEDAAQVLKENPQMPTQEGGYYPMSPMYMRTDKAPYNDIRVRHALMMATDFNTIKQSLNGGKGIIVTWPWELLPGYEELYVAHDAPDATPKIKELYTYNPEKAKQLLAEAGFPNGFKTSLNLIQNDSSYYEMIASMWQKVGVELSLSIMDQPTLSKTTDALAYDHFTTGGKSPVTTYYVGSTLRGAPGFANPSFLNDKVINDGLDEIGLIAATDSKASMKKGRELEKYMMEQGYAIPRPSYRTSTFWWPWIKNYSGESSVGFFQHANWTQFVWVDQQLKQSMGK
jgi:peptide/nickel transport system substrate-binding protein